MTDLQNLVQNLKQQFDNIIQHRSNNCMVNENKFLQIEKLITMLQEEIKQIQIKLNDNKLNETINNEIDNLKNLLQDTQNQSIIFNGNNEDIELIKQDLTYLSSEYKQLKKNTNTEILKNDIEQLKFTILSYDYENNHCNQLSNQETIKLRYILNDYDEKNKCINDDTILLKNQLLLLQNDNKLITEKLQNDIKTLCFVVKDKYVQKSDDTIVQLQNQNKSLTEDITKLKSIIKNLLPKK